MHLYCNSFGLLASI